ncbi:hypothetical protein GCM10007418_09610 [Halopseudomonas salina]|uniref:Uncharacterized protein n=1 Tax=Halopseudomonas salina TaxID=1323744 RepID=A0ABQ1PA08_9GAMM|nr:hypothetical protein GCM10007418_09610 [Halopseudomonas salina]
MSLSQESDVQGALAQLGAVIAELVGENRLPLAGPALHDIYRLGQQATTEDFVEPGYTGLKAVELGIVDFVGH